MNPRVTPPTVGLVAVVHYRLVRFFSSFSEWFYRTGALIFGWVCIGLSCGGYGFLMYRDITRMEVPPYEEGNSSDLKRGETNREDSP